MKKVLVLAIIVALPIFATSAGQERSTVLERLEATSQMQQQQPLKGVTKGAIRLFGEKDDLTSVILIVPNGSEVEILGNDGYYLRVKYDGSEGWLVSDKVSILQSSQPVTQQPVLQQQQRVQEQQIPKQQQQAQEQQSVQQQQVNRMTYLENKYGRSIANRMYAGKIWKGMTSEMVKDTWGEPDRVNRKVENAIVREEMIYRGTWLLMEQGRLKEWGPIGR
jgi:hypothetical protein